MSVKISTTACQPIQFLMFDTKDSPLIPEHKHKHPFRCKVFYQGIRDVQKSMAYFDSAQGLMSQCNRDL
jgi:hypothetical protein